MSLIAPDPDWLRIQASDSDADAWHELQDRRDRQSEHAPANHTTGAPAGQGQGAQPKETTAP